MKKFLSMAALALVGAMIAACSSSSDEIIDKQPENPTAPKVYTMVIKASKGDGATTRALKEGTSGNKNTVDAYWTGNEKIVVAEMQGSYFIPVKIGEATAAPSADGNTTITATLTAPSGIGDDLYFFLNGTNMDYTGQVGLLTGAGSISEKYDYAEGIIDRGSITVSGDKIITNDGVTLGFDSYQAIVKFTLVDKDNNDAPICAKSLTIHDGKEQGLIKINNSFGGEDIEYDDVIITPSGSTNVVYAALSFVYHSNLTLTAIDNDDNYYTYSKSDVSFINGKYYEITVKMTKQVWDGDLSKLTAEMPDAFATATDGMTIRGTLGVNKKISIADGATVTLDGVSINADGAWTSGDYAGITCLGDATIILKSLTTNTVKGFNSKYPGIYVPGDKDDPTKNKTLTIKAGNYGGLNASSNGAAAGIGGGYEISCGNVVITDCNRAKITVTGGQGAAGIGSGHGGSCGNIEITEGTIKADGGQGAAGIGSGEGGSCGNIVMASGDLTRLHNDGTVTAHSGQYGAGIGSGDGGSCGEIWIKFGMYRITAAKRDDGIPPIGYGMNGSCGKIMFDSTEMYNGSTWTNYPPSYDCSYRLVRYEPGTTWSSQDTWVIESTDGIPGIRPGEH